MSQTKKRTECPLEERDLHLPGWTPKERHDFLEGIKVHGTKKLKKLQRFVGSKTQEEVRIATELYKKELRTRQLTQDMERQIDEAGVTNEDYKTWLYFYMASQTQRGEHLPAASLEAFLDQAAPQHQATQELSFPGWRHAEIEDFLATIELSEKITNVEAHIPTKTKLEITGATDTHTIICDVRKHAIERGLRIPTYDDLKPGYIYLQCIVAALNDDEKMKNFQVPANSDPDMVKAQFVLKEWLMPDVGALANNWTRDEKYTLIVAIQAHGSYNVLRIHSYFALKTRGDVQSAIVAIKTEADYKERFYQKTTVQRYMSLISWGYTLVSCTESETKYRIAAGKRLMFALKELPEPLSQQQFMSMFRSDMSKDEMSKAMLKLSMQTTQEKGTRLAPLLGIFIDGEQKGLERQTAAAAAGAAAAAFCIERKAAAAAAAAGATSAACCSERQTAAAAAAGCCLEHQTAAAVAEAAAAGAAAAGADAAGADAAGAAAAGAASASRLRRRCCRRRSSPPVASTTLSTRSRPAQAQAQGQVE